mgnify:FL=1|tara:strand:- start:324 stop:1154 length:831 start_codon:yes stop_codon:yes gene_type:complete
MRIPIVGILATPYINNKESREQVFLSDFFIKLFKRNNLNYIIIPYNLSNIKMKTIVNKLDGLLFPGSQIGNYYYSKEFIKHLKKQKLLLKLAKSINNSERFLPILAICHGFHNSMLIESNESIDDLFINVHSYYNYKKSLKFTKHGEKLRKLFNKSNKLIHNNKLGISPNHISKTKKISLYATCKDKNQIEFVEIIKHKNYPFYGFQGHAERSNPELLIPYIQDIKKSFYNRCIISNKRCSLSNTTRKLKKMLKCKKIKCKKSNNTTCCVYNVNSK